MAKYIVTIAVLSIVIYANSLTGGFISDDIPAIVNNPRIGEISACRGFSDLSNCTAYKIGGLNHMPYHLSNIILHSINSILVFYFLLIFFGLIPSFFGALLFASHPVHSEAVSWISGRPYLFLTLFLLSSFLLYRRTSFADRPKISLYLVSLFLFVLSLFSCTYAVFYPGMIVLFDFTYKKVRKNWKLWMPYILISLVWILSKNYIIGQRVASLQERMGTTGTSNPIFNMVFSLFNHAGLVIWPVKLTLYHEPLKISPQLLGVGIFFLFLIIPTLPFLFKNAKPLFFAIGLFVIFLCPTYSPVPISWLVAERYVYFPSISFSIFIAFFMEKYASVGKAREIAVIFLVILIGAYSLRTIYRNNDWKDRAALWRATVKSSPKSPKAHNNMGDIYSIEGDMETAAREFKMATELKPDYADAYHNLGLTCQKMGRLNEAVANYKKAVSINPRLYQSYQNLGVIYLNKGELDSAKDYLQKSLEINPDNTALRQALKELGE